MGIINNNMRAFWNRVHFTNLYRQVLDKGLSIRVKRIRQDGAYELEVYEDLGGWWIFKRRHTVNNYLLDPEEGTIF